MKKKRILHFMRRLGLIKQRPHFLAEGLSAVFEVLVVHPRANRRSPLSPERRRLCPGCESGPSHSPG